MKIFFEIDIAKELSIEELNYYIKDIPYKLGYTEGTKGKYRLTAISQDKIQTHKRISNKIQIKKTTPLQSGINSQSPIQNEKSYNLIMFFYLKINIANNKTYLNH